MNTWQPRQTAPGPCSGSPLLAVNFLPVTYTAGKFPADMIPLRVPRAVQGLRASWPPRTSSPVRATRSCACRMSADASAVGKATELDVREDRRITAHLVEAALVRDVLAPLVQAPKAQCRPRS